MKKGLSEIVIILDKSGSMSGLEKDVIGGYNTLIKEQKKLKGEALVTLILFDTNYQEVYKRVNINDVKELTEKDYIPSGCTALLDSVGNAITTLDKIYVGEEEPEHIIFSIMTDGYENSSQEYSYKKIKSMIESHQEKGWSFIFQAANIDAFAEGDKLGIAKEMINNFEASEDGVMLSMKFACASIAEKRKKKKKVI